MARRGGLPICGCAAAVDRTAPHRTLLEFAAQENSSCKLLLVGFGVLRSPLVLILDPARALSLLRLEALTSKVSGRGAMLRGVWKHTRPAA